MRGRAERGPGRRSWMRLYSIHVRDLDDDGFRKYDTVTSARSRPPRMTVRRAGARATGHHVATHGRQQLSSRPTRRR